VLSATPPVDDVDSELWTIVTKPFAPKLTAGDRLRFSLRTSPTVAKKASEESRSRGHDRVMDAKQRATKAGTSFEMTSAVQQTGEQWLVAQASRSGFASARERVERVGDDGMLDEAGVNLLSVDGYQQHRIARQGAKAIRFSTVELEGVLVVRDPDTFVGSFWQGFGPQKAFGCGLMLLKRDRE
jgi:CRISPR system Cascade subunit CasE